MRSNLNNNFDALDKKVSIAKNSISRWISSLQNNKGETTLVTSVVLSTSFSLFSSVVLSLSSSLVSSVVLSTSSSLVSSVVLSTTSSLVSS